MQIGYHVNKHNGDLVAPLTAAKERLAELGMRPCAQVFVHGPRTHDETLTPAEIEDVAAVRGISVTIHGAYPDYPWKNNPQAISGIRGELKIADELEATGVVVHLGQEAANRETLLRVLGKIDRDLGLTTRRRLWLETNVVPAEKAIFSDPANLHELLRVVKSRKYSNIRVGLCLDTAHLHSCGVPLGTAKDAREFFSALPRTKYLLHLNDSALDLGCGRDQHAPLGRGKIWGKSTDGLREVIHWARETGTAIILERHPDDIEHDLGVLGGMIAGRR